MNTITKDKLMVDELPAYVFARFNMLVEDCEIVKDGKASAISPELALSIVKTEMGEV